MLLSKTLPTVFRRCATVDQGSTPYYAFCDTSVYGTANTIAVIYSK